MQVQINGRLRELPAGTTIGELVADFGLAGLVAVERNGELVPRSEHGRVELVSGDCVEIAPIVGGG